jgi:serine/threonine protein kinase
LEGFYLFYLSSYASNNIHVRMGENRKRLLIMLEHASNYLGLQIGSYRLIRLLGEGTFSQVYLGEHIYLKTQSAIKLLRIQLSPEVRDNFLHEAQTIARLEHPNIIRVLDYGVADETPFLVMNYAPNGSLRQRYPVGTRLSLAEILPILMQIAPALDYAHQRRLIHRDVKPENILIGQEDQMFLSDFGLVLEAHSHSSQTIGKAAGTVLYMAPEQFQGNVRYASDQYALGIIAYQWLCGECPFNGTFAEIISQHLYTPIPALGSRVPGLAPIVERMLLKALAKDPNERYESTVAFVNALQKAFDSPLSHIELYNTDTVAEDPLATVALSLDALAATDLPVEVQSAGTSRRSNSFWRIALPLLAVLIIIAGSLSIWYGSIYFSPETARTSPAATPRGTHTASKTPLESSSPSINATAIGTIRVDPDNNGTTLSTPVGKVDASQPTPQPTKASKPVAVVQPTSAPQPTPLADCISGSTTMLVFTSYRKEQDPAVVTLTNCGGLSGWNASAQTSDGNNWLNVSPSSGSIAQNGSEDVQVSVDHAGLQRGTYQGELLFVHGSASFTVTVINVVRRDANG